MTNATGSVFDPSATHRTVTDLTRLYASGLGSEGVGYITLVDTVTKTSTDISATASIEAAADMGIDVLNWTPSGATNQTFKTGRMRKLKIDTTNGAITTPAHGVAGFDYLELAGSNNIDDAFVHESKIKKLGSSTVARLSCYKPARDEIEGIITQLALYDADFDLTGIAGTVTTCYSLYSPRTNLIALQSGGLQLPAKLIVANYTLTKYDNNASILSFAGTPITVTVPASLPAGFHCRVCQGDANKITFAASGGNSILNYSSHTKTAGALAEVMVTAYTAGSGGAVILSGNTGA